VARSTVLDATVLVVTPSQKDLIQRALALVSSQKVLGARLEISKARVSRVVHGARLSVTNCLFLADLLNELPSVVLRAYKYPQQADVLERAYRARAHLPRSHVEVLDALDRLDASDVRLIAYFVTKFAAGRAQGSGSIR
jgi:hypothetical protein